MKSLRRRAEKSRDSVRPGLLRRGVSRLKLGIATCTVATSMAFAMPLMEAKANPPPAPAAAKQLYSVKGMKATLNYAGKNRTVYAMATTLKPLVKLQGPAEITIRVYPAVLKTAFVKQSEFVHKIECSSGPVGKTQTTTHYSGKTRDSNIQHSMVGSTIAIGTPIPITVKVGPGPQQFKVLKPNGFFEVVGVKLIRTKPRKPPRKVPRIRIRIDPPKKVKKPPKKVVKDRRTVLSVAAERVQIKDFGPDRNRGDIYSTEILGHIPVSRSISLLVGPIVTSFGLVLDSTDASTSIRGLSTNLALGMSYTRGKHRFTVLGFGGYRHMWSKVSVTDGSVLKNEDSQGEGGGAVSYAYDPYFSMLVLGKHNPFNPLTVKLVGTLPKGLPWVKGNKPSLEVAYNWLRAAVKTDEEGYLGGVEMSHNAHDLIAVADLPLHRLKMFTLSAIAGAEMTISHAGDVWGTGLFGGALTFEHNGVTVQFRGYSSLKGMPFLFLNLSYSR